MDVKTLIDRAAEHVGSVSAVARALDRAPSAVFAWRAGTRPCPIEVQAKLCQLAELSAGEAWDHIKDQSGAVVRKIAAATTVIALTFGGLLGIAAAPSAAHATGRDLLATMYIT
jgi:hypothetical protein